MRPTRQLHDLGQSLWLDNITRALLDNGTLRRYIEDFSITGLTSNPTIFDGAIGGGDTYDDRHPREGRARTNPAKRCSSNWRWRIFAAPPICSARCLTPADQHRRLGLDGSLAAAGQRHRWQHQGRRRKFTSRPTGRICS